MDILLQQLIGLTRSMVLKTGVSLGQVRVLHLAMWPQLLNLVPFRNATGHAGIVSEIVNGTPYIIAAGTRSVYNTKASDFVPGYVGKQSK